VTERIFEPRVRFNWGFHNATLDGEDKRERSVEGHFDSFYAEGYRWGRASFAQMGKRVDSSEDAWQGFVAGLEVTGNLP
jgi:hypothetical protein